MRSQPIIIMTITHCFIIKKMKIEGDYIAMEYDRSHLQTSYSLNFLPKLQTVVDTLDFIVILLNFFFLIATLAYCIYKRSKRTKQRVIQIEKPDKNNIFPYFSPKIQRKGKGRDVANKEGKDHSHMELICEKCKYVTEINEKNLITHSDRH